MSKAIMTVYSEFYRCSHGMLMYCHSILSSLPPCCNVRCICQRAARWMCSVGCGLIPAWGRFHLWSWSPPHCTNALSHRFLVLLLS